MEREHAIAIVKVHASELKELGAESISLFGSTARNEAGPYSDVDVAVRLSGHHRGFRAFGSLDRIKHRLHGLLGRRVDVVPEPSQPGPLKRAIDRDRCLAF